MEHSWNMIRGHILQLRRRIDLYLQASGMAATRFGREALGDPAFVHDLRSGREPRKRTIDRVVEFLERAEARLKTP
jgi:hypothetical protein